MQEGVILDVGVEVDAAFEADGVGGGPAAEGGVVVAAAEVDEACFVLPFGGESPGVGVKSGGVVAEAVVGVMVGSGAV